jgi:hypothetical protein
MARLPNTCRLTDDALSFGSTRSGGDAEIARTNCKVRIVTRPREKSAGRCPFASCAIGQTRMTKIVGISNGAAWRGPRQELGKAGQAAHPSTQSCCSLDGSLAGAPGFEPGNGGIKISLIVQRFQRAFGKIGQNGALTRISIAAPVSPSVDVSASFRSQHSGWSSQSAEGRCSPWPRCTPHRISRGSS